MKRRFDAAYRQYTAKTVYGEGAVEWSGGVKSVFPFVKLLGRTVQAENPTPDAPVSIRANNATVRCVGRNALDLVGIFGDGSTNTLNGVTAAIRDGYAILSGTHTNTGWSNVLEVTRITADSIIIPAGTYSLPLVEKGAFAVRLYDVVTGASLGNKTGTFSIESACEVRTVYIAVLGEQTVSLSVPLVLAFGAEPATSYEPCFDGGQATAPNLMCAADGSCQSTYDPQTGEFVDWWMPKITLDGSESWSSYDAYQAFYVSGVLPGTMNQRNCWNNMSPPRAKSDFTSTGVICGIGNNLLYYIRNPFYNADLKDKGVANWKAHLAEHPLEVWIARSAPEITNIGPQRLICPTGYGQIIQTAGDIPEGPLEVKCLTHVGM